MGGTVGARAYELSGMRIVSEIPLVAPQVDVGDRIPADVTIVLGETRDPPFERPSADVVAELVVDGFPRYTICRVADGYVCRIVSVGDFVIDAGFRRVVCYPTGGGRRDVLPIIVAGTVTAFILAMNGWYVLHGSAVEIGGRALAFVGTSGQGKSTMAAMFCATGASLVTDDILPLEFTGSPEGMEIVRCLPSSTEIRLREKAASLAKRFDSDAQVRVTADERHAVEPRPTALDRIPLGAIVLPRPDREHSEVTARQLNPGEAAFWLSRCQRIEGWQDRASLRTQFDDAARVVQAVPVFEVLVPWGPPFAVDLPQRILESCGIGRGLPLPA
jgi:hypothetical protein